MTSIGIIGSQGRMGLALAAAISEAGSRDCGIDKGGNVAKLAADADVLVDFSSPAALEATLDACIAAQRPIVIGTTGLEERHHYLIDDASKDIAVLQTGNTSLDVTLLAHLVKEAAAKLDPEWDIEIVEMHHRCRVPRARLDAEGRRDHPAAGTPRGEVLWGPVVGVTVAQRGGPGAAARARAGHDLTAVGPERGRGDRADEAPPSRDMGATSAESLQHRRDAVPSMLGEVEVHRGDHGAAGGSQVPGPPRPQR